jgi:hypothetical protein
VSGVREPEGSTAVDDDAVNSGPIAPAYTLTVITDVADPW